MIHEQSHHTAAKVDMAECFRTVETPSIATEIQTELSSIRRIELRFLVSAAKQAESREKEVENEVKVHTVEDNVIPPMRKRGRPLSYVAQQLKQGIPTAKLQVTEIEKEAMKWRNAIIFYVIGG